jgi:hypothetical protein
MSTPQYGDYQFDIYFDGLEGRLPKYPVDFASLERRTAAFPTGRASGPCCVPTARKKPMRHWPSFTGPGATQ